MLRKKGPQTACAPTSIDAADTTDGNRPLLEKLGTTGKREGGNVLVPDCRKIERGEVWEIFDWGFFFEEDFGAVEDHRVHTLN